MTKRCLCPMAICFLLGIVFFVRGSWWVILPAAMLAVFIFLRFQSFDMARSGLIFAAAALLSFAGGMLVGHHNNYVRGRYLDVLKDGQRIKVEGTLVKKETKSYWVNLYLEDGYVLLDTGAVPCRGVILQADSDDYAAGSTLAAEGVYQEFSTARNDGNYDEREYNFGRGVDIKLTHISYIEEYENQYSLREPLYRLRERMKEVIAASLSESAAGTLGAMVLGDKTSLLDEDKTLYSEAGLSHILSVSGLHVSLLCMGLYHLLRKLRAGVLPAVCASSVFAISYCLFTGENTATIRAVGMFLISMAAMALGEAYDLLSALSVLAVIVAALNPLVIFTAAFLLSFGAVLGIALTGQQLNALYRELVRRRNFVRSIKRKLARDERREDGEDQGPLKRKGEELFIRVRDYFEGLLSIVLMNLGIILTTLPVVAWFYFEIPTLSLIVNLIVLPLMGALLCLGFIGALAGCGLYALGFIILRPCEWIISLYRATAAASTALPFSHWVVGRPRFSGILLYYLLLVALLFGLGFIRKRLAREAETGSTKETPGLLRARICGYLIILSASTVLLGGILSLFVPKPPGITVLDVDQGEGTFIRTADGTTIFMDGGSTGVKNVGKYRILPYLKYHGTGHIDYWFVSHSDEDHVNGMEEIIEGGYRVKNLVVSDSILPSENTTKLLETAKNGGANIYRMSVGDELICGSEKFTCVFPIEEYSSEDANALSLVLLYENPDYQVLFTGDIGKAEEKELMKTLPITHEKPMILRVAHHGSKNSSDAEFLDSLLAEYAIISVGIDNSYGHPSRETLEKLEGLGCTICRTDEMGQITIEMGQKNGRPDKAATGIKIRSRF